MSRVVISNIRARVHMLQATIAYVCIVRIVRFHAPRLRAAACAAASLAETTR